MSASVARRMRRGGADLLGSGASVMGWEGEAMLDYFHR